MIRNAFFAWTNENGFRLTKKWGIVTE